MTTYQSMQVDEPRADLHQVDQELRAGKARFRMVLTTGP
jgi:hypothetical protein